MADPTSDPAAAPAGDADSVARLHLSTTEQRNPASADLDRMSALEIVRVMNAEDHKVADAVERALPQVARAVDAVVAGMRSGGRLIYMGAGTSGRLGVLDAAECPPTFRTDPELVVGLIAGGRGAMFRAVEGAEDSAELGASDLDELGLTDRDTVVGIAASGRTPYVIGGLDRAREVGAATVSIACNLGAVVSRHAEIAIEVDNGPEVVTGSSRLKSGTSQKLVLNMISTAAMVRLGKVYGNLMVDVAPTNTKLVDRAERIVVDATGCDRATAQAALRACDGHAKTAIVMVQRGVDAPAARAALTAAGGFVRQAIQMDTQPQPPVPTASAAADCPEGVPPAEARYLGLDIGGSSTRAVVCTAAGTVLHRGSAGGGNIHSSSASLRDSIEQALRGCDMSRVVSAAAGVAGAGAARGAEVTETVIGTLGSLGVDRGACTVVSDFEIAYRSAAPGPDGRLLIAGTGAVAARFDDWTPVVRRDGLGWLLGDTGSGTWIGRQVLRAVASDLDGAGPATALTSMVQDALGATGTVDSQWLVRAVADTRPAEWARFAPLALSADGDPVVAQILDAAADALVRTVESVGDGTVVLAGGLLTGRTSPEGRRSPLRERIERALGPCITATAPVIGACALAAERAGAVMDREGAVL